MEFRVYLVNLQNNEGKWLTLPMDADELAEEIEEFTKGADYGIFDHEGPFYIDQFVNIHELNEQLNELEIVGKHFNEREIQALLEFVDFPEDAISLLREERVRFYDTGKENPQWSDLAELLVYEYDYMEVPDYLKDYIDYDHVGRNLYYEGNWYLSGNGIAVEIR